ncbi:MAG: hypothetical protein V2J26_08370 [Pacificimonas sp.]|jgi:hypothetical protein|nr:hypothetical protein [Pacificimonas sp.]
MATAPNRRLIRAGVWGLALTLQTGAAAEISQDLALQLRGVASSDPFGGGYRSWIDTSVTGSLTATYNRLNANVNGTVGRREVVSGFVPTSVYAQGSATARLEALEDKLFLDAGGSARQGQQAGGGALGAGSLLTAQQDLQLYSVFLSPRIVQRLNEDMFVVGNYRLTYQSSSQQRQSPGIAAPQPQAFGNSVSHSFGAQLGYRPRGSRLSAALQGSHQVTEVSNFDQQFVSSSVSATANYRASRHLTVGATAGYQSIDNSQAVIVLNPITGRPVLDEDGEIVTDPTARSTAFSREAVIATLNLSYRPSNRFSAQVRGGYRDIGTSIDAQVAWRVGANTSLTLSANRDIQTPGLGDRSRTFAFDDEVTITGPDGEELDIDVSCPIALSDEDGSCLLTQSVSALAGTSRRTRVAIGTNWRKNSTSVGLATFYQGQDFLDPRQFQEAGAPDFSGLGDRSIREVGGSVSASTRLTRASTISGSVQLSDVDDLAGRQGGTRVQAQLNYRRSFAGNFYLTGSAAYLSGQPNLAPAGGQTADDSIHSLAIGLGYRF